MNSRQRQEALRSRADMRARRKLGVSYKTELRDLVAVLAAAGIRPTPQEDVERMLEADLITEDIGDLLVSHMLERAWDLLDMLPGGSQ